MIQVTLCGFAGRMGRELNHAMTAAPDLQLVLGLEHPEHCLIGTSAMGIPIVSDLEVGWRPCHLVVDFSLGAETARLAEISAANGAAFLSGATGLSAADFERLDCAAKTIPVLHANNMSRGVSVTASLIEQAARALPGYDIELVEFHHRQKKDAPSGTARYFLQRLQTIRRELRPLFGRSGNSDGRTADEIGIHSLRGGDAVGEHRVIFSGPGERLVVTHLADNRSAFVYGVLAAARFLVGKPPRLYTMDDVFRPAGE